jgi:endonuclease IV
MVSLVLLSIFHYVSLIRSTYYMAFLDQKEENDKNIVVHASYILDCL